MSLLDEIGSEKTKSMTDTTTEQPFNSPDRCTTTDKLVEELLNTLLYGERLYELEEVVAEYKTLNNNILDVLERLDDIILIENICADDLKYLKKRNIQYTKRRIRKSRKDNCILNYDIFSNVLNATLKEAYDKSNWFFGGDDLVIWEWKLDSFRNFFIANAGKYTAEMIQFINIVYRNLREIHIDFNTRDDSFKATFNFDSFLLLSEQLTEPCERINFFNLAILNCQKMCLAGQIKNPTSYEQEEFIQKCLKAIEIINLEIQISEAALTSSITNEDKSLATDSTSELQPQLPSADSLPEVDITLNRQFLAIYYMLNKIDSNSFARNKSEIARFIQLLTGKSYHNIYKYVKNPIKDPSERVSRKYQDDIHFLVETFRKLGLDSIAANIENDNLIG